jgi:hypothetical protein
MQWQKNLKRNFSTIININGEKIGSKIQRKIVVKGEQGKF